LSPSTSATNSSIPTPAGQRCQSLEQTRRDATALEFVGHREGNLGNARIAQADIARKRDDEVVLRADERPALDPIGIEHRLDQACVYARMAVEAEVEAPVGEAAEEVEQRVRIRHSRRTQPHRRAVT